MNVQQLFFRFSVVDKMEKIVIFVNQEVSYDN
jgi:hypothetical protein